MVNEWRRKLSWFGIDWKILGNDIVKLFCILNFGNMGSKMSCSKTALGVTAGIFSHQLRPFGLAETLYDQLVVPNHAGLLLVETGIGRDRFTPDGRRGLRKQPGPAQTRAGNHNAIDVKVLEHLQHFFS